MSVFNNTAFEQPWKTLTGVPGADFKGKRYTAITYAATGKVATAAAGKRIIGIIQEPNNVDEPANVIAQGFSYVVYGGTVAAGDDVAVGTDGKLIKAADAAIVVGIAAVGGAANDIGTVLLK